MASAILTVFQSLFGWIGALLPSSPVAGWLVITDNMQLGLGWLNWFFPVQEMIVMLTAWITLLVGITALRMFLDAGGNIANKVSGLLG